MRDFSYDSYRKMLQGFRRGYEFATFSQVKKSKQPVQRKIVLRHDVDLSVEKAVEMAEVEAEMGISATYFIFLRCPFYNPLSGSESRLIRRIISLQHPIGLHFDFNKYGPLINPEVVSNIMKEIQFVEDFFELKLDAVSFHRPVSLEFFKRLKIDSYPHTYEPLFVKEFVYFSDSRAQWRYGFPLESEAFKKGKNLHILVHPIWWNERNLGGAVCVKKFREGKYEQIEAYLQAELKSFWETLDDG